MPAGSLCSGLKERNTLICSSLSSEFLGNLISKQFVRDGPHRLVLIISLQTSGLASTPYGRCKRGCAPLTNDEDGRFELMGLMDALEGARGGGRQVRVETL